MTRLSDPCAIRLHREWRPYSHVARPRRVAARQQMHGALRPMDEGRDPSATWFVIGALVIAFFFGCQLLRGVL